MSKQDLNYTYIFRRLAEESRNALCLTDLNHQVLYTNPAWKRMFGMTVDSGISLFDLYRDNNLEQLQQQILPVVEKDGEWQGPVSLILADESILHTLHKVFPVHNDDTDIIAIGYAISDITEQSQLHESLQIYQTAIESSLNALAFANLEGKLTYVNPAFISMWHLKDRNHAIGLSVLDFWLDPQQAENVVVTLKTNGQWQGTMTALRPDGTEAEMELVAQLVQDSDQQPLCMMASFIEVTERQRQEEQLRLSEARLNEAQKIASVGSWELDLQTNHLFWTDEIFHLFEIEKNNFEASYDAFLQAIHPEDREAVNAAYTQSLKNQKPYAITHRLKMPDGRIKWVEERCSTDFDTDGNPLLSRGTVQDITAHYELEKRLRELNEKLEQRIADETAASSSQHQRNEAILETTPDGFFAADITGALRQVNPAFCNMLGYTQEELLHMKIADFEAIEDEEAVKRHQDKILKDKHDLFETMHQRKDGTTMDVEMSVSLVQEPAGAMFYAFARDITERKQAQNALIQTRDEAERANEAKSEFLSRMSHELRTPMNAILGFAQLLSSDPDEPLSKIQASNVREILQAGDHLLNLINEVLDLAKIESGHLDIQLEPVDIIPILKDCISQMKPLAALQNLKIEIESNNRPMIRGDKTRVRQILLNLLSNAVKYNRPGGEVRVRCEVYEEKVRVSIQDTGIGIDSNSIDRVFRPFERLSSAYSGIEGTGIGLSLSKQLVENMAGEIGAESTVDVGSTFWFELPLAEDSPASHKPTYANDNTEMSTDLPQHHFRVLYVEDNPANLRLVERILSTKSQIELISADHGQAGLKLAIEQKPDLILLDLNLPGLDGFEIKNKLSQHSNTADIPVIAITANAMPSDIEKGKQAGFSHYLTKPLNVRQLYEAMNEFLN